MCCVLSTPFAFSDAVEQDFVKPKHRALLVVENDAGRLLNRFDALIAFRRTEKRFDPSVT